MNEETHPVEPPVHRHEPTDANTRSLMWFGVGLLALILFGFIVTEIAFHVFVGARRFEHPTSFFTRSQMPPPPLIQEQSGKELQDYEREQNRILDTYGWVDRKAGIVRVPISEAMDMLLKKGFPVRTGPPTLAPSTPHELPRGDFAPPVTGVKGPQHQ